VSISLHELLTRKLESYIPRCRPNQFCNKLEMRMHIESVDEYYAAIYALAEEFASYSGRLRAFAFCDLLASLPSTTATCLRNFRRNLLTDVEKEQFRELVSVFPDQTEEDAIALLAVSVDLQNAVRIRHSKNIHRLYEPGDPINVDSRKLKAGIRDDELVSLEKLKDIPEEWFVYKFGFNRLYLDAELDPRIVKLALTDVPREKVWIRLLPSPPDYVLGDARPKHLWLCDLPNRVDDSGEALPKHPIERVDGTIKLQWAGRYQANKRYFSLSVEQLIKPNAEPWCYGLMIHLDGYSDRPEIEMDNRLEHLDLAINYYEGLAAKDRLEQPHDMPKKTDADYRIHLFRVEGMRYELVSLLAQLFLPGTTSLFEWMKPIRHLGELPRRAFGN